MERKKPEAKKTGCRSCELNDGKCLFCTKESLVLIGLAIVFVAINNTYTRYLAWALLLVAFFVPLIKNALRRR